MNQDLSEESKGTIKQVATLAANKEPVRVAMPNWRMNRPQIWNDGWRNNDRTLRYCGKCEHCGKRTYAFDDGQNDPRGILGDRANDTMHAIDYGNLDLLDNPKDPRIEKVTVVACFSCTNDEPSYRYLVDVLNKRLRRAATKWQHDDVFGGEAS